MSDAKMTNELVDDLDNLRHMLGASGKARDYGYRNYYNTSDCGPDVDSMKRLQAFGLVIPGRTNYWHATEAGCRAIGLNEKQIKRALHSIGIGLEPPPASRRNPRVVHVKREHYDVLIDRQTHWGNPFVIGQDGTREQVIGKYRAWIMEPDNAHMVELAKRELRGKVLGCWCAPKACHGDVLLEIANG